MFDTHYDDKESRAESDDKKKKMRERGVPEDAIKKIFDPLEEDEEDYAEGFEDPNEQYSFHEDTRYKERDYGLYDSHVLESVLTSKDDMRHFQPYWHNDDEELLCSIEFIYYDIYPLTENKQKHLIHFLGLFGLVALIACIYDLTIGNTGIIVDGKITESALGVIYGLMFIFVFVVYKLKKQYNAKHEYDE